jgi:CubicO group peptidase (beta-lactamase class C family)
MTKPVTAAAALLLVEDRLIRLDDPIDDFLPEMADRQVLVSPSGPLADTVPAHRPVTARDLLTFRLGLGMDFTATEPQRVLVAMDELGIGGRSRAIKAARADEWIHRVGTLPLADQPGERWLYHTTAEMLGVLIGRAAGQPSTGSCTSGCSNLWA